MLVRDLMTSPAVTAPPALSLPDAAHLMKTRGIRRLPVVDESGHLIGIATDRDLREALPSKVSTLSPWEATTRLAAIKVSDVMRRSVLTVPEDADARDAAYTMLQHRVGALPVVDAQGQLSGLITVTDVLRDYAREPVTREPLAEGSA
ncbi:acetoin utilization protein AcuB [Deinococcus reticulitermitis]|uniref:Acetoin utilization protein AcuB n=1 Tax=Deinococcus reticulitermitis TaxID=856736 RepID=A0A1H6ZPU3_9DEIO|nr:CBS domain-containing protein [Deinococcus reticulitermitis]SEJ50825.1 acetoin utilization protein AcuB [Deinococcus reticulitermitis]